MCLQAMMTATETFVPRCPTPQICCPEYIVLIMSSSHIPWPMASLSIWHRKILDIHPPGAVECGPQSHCRSACSTTPSKTTTSRVGRKWQRPSQFRIPLALLYQGEECWSFSEFLASTVFDGEDVHRIEASSLSDAMQVGMGKHFRHRNDDYLLVATWESEGQGKEAFIAVNHLFHDISSVSALLHSTTRYSNRKCRPQHCIKRVPLPCESRAMKPIKKTKLHFPWGSLREEANLLGFSANEYLFYKCSVAISRALREEFDFTCLHSSRKEQAVDRQAFGDYSCYARSLRVTQEIERQPDAVSSYFGRLRSGEYVLREDDSSLLGDSSGWWVFDTWLHSDVVAVRPGVVLNTSALMFSYSLFVDRFVIAIDDDKGVDVFVFSDRFEL